MGKRIWFDLFCYNKRIKIEIEKEKLDKIYGNEDYETWIDFKRAIESVGGVIKDFYD